MYHGDGIRNRANPVDSAAPPATRVDRPDRPSRAGRRGPCRADRSVGQDVPKSRCPTQARRQFATNRARLCQARLPGSANPPVSRSSAHGIVADGRASPRTVKMRRTQPHEPRLAQMERCPAGHASRCRVRVHVDRPRSRDQHTLLAARRPDPGLDDRPSSVHRPAARGTCHARRRLHDRPGVLLDPVGDSRPRRTVVPEHAACGRHRPGDSPVRRRHASARRDLASHAVSLDRGHSGGCAGHGRIRCVPVCARLESGPRIDAGQGGNRPGLAGLAPEVGDARRAHRGAGVDRGARVYRRDLRRGKRLRCPSRRSVRPSAIGAP